MVDLKSGFWQVRIAKESRKWTSFITHNGHYKWKVMPFELKKIPCKYFKKNGQYF